MLENESNYQGTPSQEMTEQPLFKNYELRSWNFSPRIYKIFAFAALLNLVAIFGIGQTNLLTVKGCDSPIIGSVCQVLDTVYMGSKLYGTDSEYVDEAYNPTDLSNSDIVYLNMDGQEPPLTYPAGYFDIANPERAQMTETGIDGFPAAGNIPGIGNPFPSAGNSRLEDKAQVLPTPNSNVVDDSKLQKGFDDFDGNTGNSVASIKRPRGRSGLGPISSGKVNNVDPTAGFPQMSPTPPVKAAPLPSVKDITDIQINRRPLDDLGRMVNTMLEQNQVNLLANVNIKAKGKLDEEGKIDGTSFDYKMVDPASDPAMTALIQQAILRLSESGYLKYLGVASVKDVDVSIVQDDANFTAVVTSEVESANRARTLQILLQSVIKVYKDKKTGPGADDNDRDDLALLEKTFIETDGKKLIVKFLLPKPEAQALIKKKLQLKPPAPPAQSAAQTQNANTSTGK